MNEHDREALKVAREADELSNDRAIVETYQAAKDTFQVTAVAFNHLREELQKCKNLIWGMESKNKTYVAEMQGIRGCDVESFVSKVWELKPGDVDSHDAFCARMEDAAKTGNPLLRMRKLRQIKKALDAGIESAKSKLNGMRDRAAGGANENETAVCMRKIVAFESLLDELKKRVGKVREAFLATQTSVERHIEREVQLMAD